MTTDTTPAPDRVAASVRAQIGNMIYNLSQESYPCEREAVVRSLNGVLDSLAAADAAALPVLGEMRGELLEIARSLSLCKRVEDGDHDTDDVLSLAEIQAFGARMFDLLGPETQAPPEPVASAESEGKWVVGDFDPCEVYSCQGSTCGYIGKFHTPGLAARAVEAVNALPALQADLIDARASLDECRDQRDSEASDREVFEQRADAQAKLIRTLAEALPVFAGIYQELDRQTYDDNVRQDFDAPDDFEHCLMLTAKMVRQFNKAFEQLDAALTQTKEAGYVE